MCSELRSLEITKENFLVCFQRHTLRKFLNGFQMQNYIDTIVDRGDTLSLKMRPKTQEKKKKWHESFMQVPWIT